MLGSLGFAEIAFIMVLALLIFGPKRLPEAGKLVGRAMGEFRRASNELRRTFNAELSLDEEERGSGPRRVSTSRPKKTESAPSTVESDSPGPSPERPPGSVARGDGADPVSSDPVSSDPVSSDPASAEASDPEDATAGTDSSPGS